MAKDLEIERPKGKIPRSVPFIIGNEFSERFSFYGMKSILAIFLVNQFFNPSHNPALTTTAEAQSNYYNHLFSTLVYFTPLVGAVLADWFFGKYRLILFGSIIYTFGHFILSMFDTSLNGFVAGLVVIAIAAGGIKSCVSANVGDQFDHSNQHLMSKIYSWFYFSINAGSTVSILLIPYLYEHFGAAVAFGVPGVLMALATVIFFSGRKQYVKVPPSGVKKQNFITVSAYMIGQLFSKKAPTKTAWQNTEVKYGAEKTEAIRAIWSVMAVFAFIPIFWGMWDMNSSEWALQADKLNLDLGALFGHLHILPSQVQFVNALFLLILIPVFNYGIYPLVEKIGIKLTPLRKIGAGLFITGFSFVIIALIQIGLQNGHQPSIWWQILAFVVLSAGEVMVSITGLEYAYTQSPPSMKSTMTGLWYFTYSVGTFFTTLISKNIANKGVFSYFEGDKYFWLFVGIMAFFVVLFIIVSPYIKEKSFLVDDTLAKGLNIKGDHTNEIHPDNPIV
ncbi:POT family MFS transporter [Mucilaginibacter pallidiroseus]|uniref:POT family MFS transporter n=1 Tax=Mucilaginibacter pallidiroseus TaxID=2599295 RepID=A0A563UJM5_9SPHI|nr:MFS transporter [Mucilaginibacter pallidiroseus]TWR31572.1 POT family MFS transporter [Mucilaginibacter pallidiroseus]